MHWSKTQRRGVMPGVIFGSFQYCSVSYCFIYMEEYIKTIQNVIFFILYMIRIQENIPSICSEVQGQNNVGNGTCITQIFLTPISTSRTFEKLFNIVILEFSVYLTILDFLSPTSLPYHSSSVFYFDRISNINAIF